MLSWCESKALTRGRSASDHRARLASGASCWLYPGPGAPPSDAAAVARVGPRARSSGGRAAQAAEDENRRMNEPGVNQALDRSPQEALSGGDLPPEIGDG